MARPSLPLTGACHCGAVTYQISEPPLTVLACHCRNCQRITGSAFAMSVIIQESTLSISGDAGQTEWIAESGNKRWGKFCKDCGSRIVHGSAPSTGTLVVRAGTLDDISWLEPVAHIWTREAQPWFMFADDDVTFEEQHTDNTPLIEKFQRLRLFTNQP